MPEIKLHKLNRKFSVLLEHFDGGVLIEDETRHIAYVNKKFCQMFSIPLEPQQLIGYDCAQAAKESSKLFEDPADFLEKTDEAVKACQPLNSQQLKMKDGRVLEREYIPIIENQLDNASVWLYRDISKYLNIESSLKYRLDFEELITNLSYSFISAKIDNLDRVINLALENIGRFIGVDRSYIFRFSGDLKEMSNAYEWCSEDCSEEKDNLQNLPTDMFPWWMERLVNMESIALDSIEELPEEASAEKAILQPQGIKSLVIVPVVYSYELLGYLGFDCVRKYRKWDKDSVMLLRVFSDILSGTLKRKENEQRLQASQRQYKSVVDNLTEVIFQTDKDGVWTFLNPAWEAITGFKVEESLGRLFLDYVHPDDRQRNSELFIPLINREKDYCRHQIRYLKKDGGFCWIEVFAKLTFDESGQITGTSGTLNDITARKLNEDEIRKLSKAVESTPTAVVLTDLEGNVIFINNGLLRIGSYNREEDIINKNIYDFTNAEGVRKLTTEILPLLYEGKDWQGEMELVGADGSLLPVTMVCSMINDELGRPQYLLANFINISEQKRAEAEIKKALLKEKELNEMKSRFVSLVSHEFRTPLAAILSSAEILEYYSAKFTPEQKEQQYQKIKTSINNLLDILNEVSEINRIDSGKVTLAPKKIIFDELLKEILDEIYTTYKDRPEIIIRNNCRALELTADKKLLRQITLNLISNAVKYTANDRKVRISIESSADEFIFEVEDEGIGIPEKEQESIFEPFMRSSKTQNIKGTGLGLSIAQKAAEMLGGKMSLKSREKEGSTFTVKLPLKA
ncbi:MAG: PAS domain S-box protein [Ignavibacteria bacterium]|nr:PAS domain S-box protein [Ignavibacteria bacterium]MCU7505260.1 PAS domain S-box protein [Ignavibacteria bacterium]MCU7518504.1 PAS domain S-box protein [Ignavibacteria bacterium]